jgi:hypothetical protein
VQRAMMLTSALTMIGALALGGVAAAGSSKPLTKRQFIKQADKICQAGNTKANALAQQYFAGLGPNDKVDPASIAAFWRKVRPILLREVKGIRALHEPKADTKTVNKILAAVKQAVATTDVDPRALLTGDAFAEPDRLSQKYGLKVCGASSSGGGQ